MTRVFGLSAVVAVIALLISTAFAIQARVDPETHRRYASALLRAEDLDALLDSEIARSRLGLVTHYDGFVRLADHTKANRAILAAAPTRIAVAQEFGDYDALVRAKGERLELFKSDHAVLRNALRLLPFMADRLVGRLEPDSPLRHATLTAVAEVLRGAVDPSKARWSAARCELARLGAPAVEGCALVALSVPLPYQEAVADVVQHALVIVERQPTVDGHVHALQAFPVAASARSLLDAYDRSAAQARAVQWRRGAVVGLLAVAVILLSSLAIINRLLGTTLALRQASAQLEIAMGELTVERDRQAELAKLKNRFVAMTSHEFRTPLSVIMSSADLLQAYGDGWDGERRSKHLARVMESGRAMTRMLDRILVIGRAESGLLELQPSPVVVGALLEAVVREVRTVVGSARSLEVVNETEHVALTFDERLMKHVLTNLLSNAFKYSSDDSVVRLGARQEVGTLSFTVADEGIGIPDAERAELFEPFHRCTNALAFDGTGLGLAVVKRSVDVHGGSIEVDSAVGRGTRFVVRIPAEAA